MPDYPYVAEIEATRLRIDVKNPRIANQPDKQRDAYGRLAEAQSDRFLALSKHVARHGLGPQPFIVTPGDDGEDDGEPANYIVLDGNRRLTVLRALETPSILDGHVTEAEMRQLKAAKDDYEPIVEVTCVVFDSRDAANIWIEMLHAGDMGGAGLLSWTAQQKARFRSRGGTQPYHLQVLDFVRGEGNLSPEARHVIDEGRYPVSTLERLLTTPEVRERAGVAFLDDAVLLAFPKGEVLKPLTKIVDDVGTGKLKVSELMLRPERIAWIEGLTPDQLPNPQTRLPAPVPIEDAPAQPGRKRRDGATRRSNRLVPSSFSPTITTSRVKQILSELKTRLNVEMAPNAVGVLLRVFFEFGLEEYIDRHGLAVVGSRGQPTLVEKGNAVITHMEHNKVLSKGDLRAAREAINPQGTVPVMHAIVHQRDFAVSANDIRTQWDRLQRFFERLWP